MRALLLLAAAARAFVIDLGGAPALTPLDLKITDSFGSSHASTTLRATWRQHLDATRADIPIRRLRFHGLLDDDMSTLLNGQANGALVFDTLDFLVARGVKPTLELSFMPDALAFNASLTNFHYKGGISMYKDEAQFRALITGLLNITVQRYGIEEVSSWKIEVWNEFNCGFGPSWKGDPSCGRTSGNFSAYIELYRATSQAVKAVDPRLQVGGPATAMLAWLPEFLAAARAASAPVDFLSSHLYPTDPGLPQTRDSFMDAVAGAAAVAQGAGLPLLLTEFNAGLGPPALCHNFSLLDSSFAAAFALHSHLLAQAIPALASMSWWTFTDFGFEEAGADPFEFWPGHTKFGALTRSGVPKPVYRGLQMIAAQAGGGGGAVAVAPEGATPRLYRNAGGAVVGAGEGTVDLLAAAASGSGGEPLARLVLLAGNFNSSFAALPPAAAVTVTLTGLAQRAANATATLELLDERHANPMAAWEALGSPLYPSAAHVAAEARASALVAAPLALAPSGEGSVALTFTLQPYAVARIVVTLLAA